MNYYGLRVYDMEESIVASSFPMIKEQYSSDKFEKEVKNMRMVLNEYPIDIMDYCKLPIKEIKLLDNLSNESKTTIIHIKRAMNLGNAVQGSGHDCMLKGCLVSINIKADQSFWLQWERYHHQDTISSMSTMYCITKFDIDYNLFSKYTDRRVLDILKEKIDIYNHNPTNDNFHKVIHNCPEGIELTRRVTTNYLQLKTMFNQRKHHKMYAWCNDFINLCYELPYFKELCINNQ